GSRAARSEGAMVRHHRPFAPSHRTELSFEVMSESVVKLLEGRGVLVTGASSGIGQAIAIAAARAGADVALTYRSNAAGARDTVARIRACGRKAIAFQIDLLDEAALSTLGAS